QGEPRLGLGRPHERPADLPQPRGRAGTERPGRGHPARGARAGVTGFARSGSRLLCDGVSLEEAAARHGTPLYLYSPDAIVEAYRAYQTAFEAVPHRVCYAVKANGAGAILRLFAALGAGADIVSGFELRAALRAGFPADRIVFSGVGKTEAEIAAALEAG